MSGKSWWWLAGFLACAVIGWFLARSAADVDGPPRAEMVDRASAAAPRMIHEDPVRFKTGRERPAVGLDVAAIDQGALHGQRGLVFKDRAAMDAFLEAARGRVRVLDRIDSIHALRVAFDHPDDLTGLLDGSEEESFIYPVVAPPPAQGGVRDGAVALGGALHEWLGITRDNSAWGKGVTIAILDTAVDPHRSLTGDVRSIDLVPPSAPDGDSRGHGTAVASVIAGSDPLTPGVAPAAGLISIRVADDRGYSDSFQLAKGIHAALESGADLINISMGSQGDSALVRRAVEAAAARGVLIIAAAGNNGTDRVTYPAANEGVIAVGAVDATGTHLDFSNTGEAVAIAAPGLGLNAAWTDNQAMRVNGTSFSAPVVTGSIAAMMTEAGSRPLTAAQAWERIVAVLNDAGEPGADSATGAGMPDLGRVLQAGTPGIHDAAVASQRILPATTGAPYGELETTIQNRGTETLVNTSVVVEAAGRESRMNLTTLAPNEVRAIRVALPGPVDPAQGVTTRATVNLSGNRADAKPSNNRRDATFVP